jgi:hypothetical protein
MATTMRVLLDDQPCDVCADSVGEAIAAAATLAESRGRMIVEVNVDGRAWSGAELGQVGSPAFRSRNGEVRLISAKPAELVRTTFHDAAQALGEADALQQSAAELLQAGQTAAAMDKLSDAVGIWSAVQQALIMGAQAAGMDLEALLAADDRRRAVATLNTHLKTIRSALETGDPVGLADTLLYDLPDVVTHWRSLLHDLQQRIAQAA